MPSATWQLIPLDEMVSIVRGEVQFTSDPAILYCVSQATETIATQIHRGVLSKSLDRGGEK